jgi:hypothetical protein
MEAGDRVMEAKFMVTPPTPRLMIFTPSEDFTRSVTDRSQRKVTDKDKERETLAQVVELKITGGEDNENRKQSTL